MVAITQHRRHRPIETPDESACGNQDLAGDVTRLVTREIRVERGHKTRRGTIQRGVHGHVVQQSAAVQIRDVPFVLGPVDNRVRAPGHTTLARPPVALSSAAMAIVKALTAPLPAG